MSENDFFALLAVALCIMPISSLLLCFMLRTFELNKRDSEGEILDKE